jgi:tRNA A-37 threonylcarbamoyl transferase component Bud32
MNRASAMARLGLTDAEDVNRITHAYGECLAQAQQQLVASQTVADRQQSQTRVTELVAAYELLTSVRANAAVAPGGTEQRAAPDHATVLRPVGEPEQLAELSTQTLSLSFGVLLAERLEVGALLGSGGMGDVYAAHDRLKDQDVAIKVLREDLSLSTAAKERFLAEAKVSCSLSHPNIVRVHDVGISGGHYYFSMERLKGQTLRQYMQTAQRARRTLRLDEVLGMVRQLFEALEYAHRYIVHRDLKPENIWLAEDGTVKLMDFGIARAYSHSQITKTGMTLGTAYYMAPEQQTAAQEVDWRADQYSLGVVLYEVLSGTVPMGAATPLGKLRRDLPKRAAQAVMRALAPHPKDRWPSLDEFSHALHSMPSSAGKIAAALLIGGAALGAGKYFYDSSLQEAAQASLAARPLVVPSLALVLPEILPANVEVSLMAPTLPDIADSYEEAVAAARLRSVPAGETEIIESEFVEPDPLPTVTQRPVAQKAAIQPIREPARSAPRLYEPRVESQRDRGDFLPPPPPPPPHGMRPPPRHDPRHDLRRPPPRR